MGALPAIADLPWLIRPPPEFADRCAALAAGKAADPGLEARFLAGHGLDAGGARRLGRALKRHAEAGGDLSPLAPLSLIVLANTTFDFVGDHLPAAAARHGVALDFVLPPFDQVMQQALDRASQTARAGADAVLVALDHRWFGFDRPALDEPEQALDNGRRRLESLLDALAAQGPASIILSTVPSPPLPLFGNLEPRVPGSPRGLVDGLNVEILRLANDRGALVLDTAALAARVGLDRWFDPVGRLAYKTPFAAAFDAIYADTLGRLLGALRGAARKCLVLDLDNTLWGGVVGDDGVEGLTLGPGSAVGESFLAVQTYALDLKRRGVILAVSSKNDDPVARSAFESHPEMALRLADLAIFQANWRDKPANLEAIAGALNIGLDALVLLDDNPAERAQVRAALPMVAVPELPVDPSWFPWVISAAGYFEAIAYSAEDRDRAGSYAGDARRAEVGAQARDLGDYLASLDMRLRAGPFDAACRARIAQLINKTNQFNLTTRRYTEAEVAAFQADPAVVTVQARLSDRFGDLGMIAVVIARIGLADDGVREAVVDSWLMSCRVLGRKVEEAMLSLLLERSAAAGAERVRAEYRPTAKNGMVRDLFDRLGLTLIDEDGDGVRRYRAAVGELSVGPLPHRLTRADPWT
ncbi:MAG: HAD-IIIC family phosphatase [Caulobacteraceae bacterium]|nr:HAD-IIIC family phosphatase [Caulobacteraceae bacterium]